MVLRFIVFLVLNFAALALGGFFTGSGVTSEWYTNLNQAPWTPPGWVFGVTWTSIMIFFTFYMTIALKRVSNKGLLIAFFAIQWVLNVSWNPVFFYFHEINLGLIIISLLTLLIMMMLVKYSSDLKYYSLLIVPYFIWLLIASSLNAYIFMNP